MNTRADQLNYLMPGTFCNWSPIAYAIRRVWKTSGFIRLLEEIVSLKSNSILQP